MEINKTVEVRGQCVLFFLRFYLFIHERCTQRERQRYRQREKQVPCREPPCVGLDPGTLGLCPEPKQTLNHWATQVSQWLMVIQVFYLCLRDLVIFSKKTTFFNLNIFFVNVFKIFFMIKNSLLIIIFCVLVFFFGPFPYLATYLH